MTKIAVTTIAQINRNPSPVSGFQRYSVCEYYLYVLYIYYHNKCYSIMLVFIFCRLTKNIILLRAGAAAARSDGNTCTCSGYKFQI